MSKEPQQTISLDISWQALIKLSIFALIVWAAFALKDIIFMLFVVFIFVAAVDPTVKVLQKKMPRALAVSLVFTGAVLALLIISFIFFQAVVPQFNDLLGALPGIIEKLRPAVQSLQSERYMNVFNNMLDSFSGSATSIGGNVFSTATGVFSGVFTFVTGVVLSFYLLLEEGNAKTFFQQLFPRNRFQEVYRAIRRISEQMGAWIRGLLTVMVAVGCLNFITYWILGLPSPLALGIWSGLGEMVPYVGAVMGVIPGLVLAIASGSVWKVILVLAINYFAIQQIQNFVITPKVMASRMGISPVFVIIALVSGTTLFGLVGTVVAIPMAAIITVLISEWRSISKLWEPGSR